MSLEKKDYVYIARQTVFIVVLIAWIVHSYTKKKVVMAVDAKTGQPVAAVTVPGTVSDGVAANAVANAAANSAVASGPFYLFKKDVYEWPPDWGMWGLDCKNNDIMKCHYSNEKIAQDDCLADPKCSGYSMRMAGPTWHPDRTGPIYVLYDDKTDQPWYSGLTVKADIYKKTPK